MTGIENTRITVTFIFIYILVQTLACFLYALKPRFSFLDPGPPPAQPDAIPPAPVGPPAPPSGRVADN